MLQVVKLREKPLYEGVFKQESWRGRAYTRRLMTPDETDEYLIYNCVDDQSILFHTQLDKFGYVVSTY